MLIPGAVCSLSTPYLQNEVSITALIKKNIPRYQAEMHGDVIDWAKKLSGEWGWEECGELKKRREP